MALKKKILALFFSFMLIVTPLQANVKVGIVFFYPPYVMSSNEGFDVDLIRSIFQRLNIDFVCIPMDFHKLFNALSTGQIDIAISGITISLQRKQKYLFSLPYMLSYGQFLTLKQSNINSIDSLQGKTVGVIRGDESGGIFYSYIYSKFNTLFNLSQYNDIEDVITALSSGEIAAAFLDKSTADYWQQNSGDQFREFDSPIQIGLGIGVMALPSNKDLIEQINAQLEIMEKDGTYLKLYSTYFPSN